MSDSKGEANHSSVPWEIWLLAGLGIAGGTCVTWFGADPEAKGVPDLNDLLPWWVPVGLLATLAIVGFLSVVAPFSQSKKERKRFARMAGIVQPLAASLTAGAALGVAIGWSLVSLVQSERVEVFYAVLAPMLILCLGLGLSLAGSKPWVKRWHQRLNP
ncbi:hypothetical protein [Aeromicrobium wangtongii]|uniref:Uncharacterized protein n=1 Tax=Aeromicrobium wangtongii TaxID=2969247 RepID=A0ABY5MEW0_9ACTN|nr:hypothetical protein [Aeromicrobium wangtongii]MCD9197800.1 hypothetical protein [Aeromicrobium wangtongii]UUP15282.1 hypothetical protein NQV15_08215 [Aeromicrobium wangtongii]